MNKEKLAAGFTIIPAIIDFGFSVKRHWFVFLEESTAHQSVYRFNLTFTRSVDVQGLTSNLAKKFFWGEEGGGGGLIVPHPLPPWFHRPL